MFQLQQLLPIWFLIILAKELQTRYRSHPAHADMDVITLIPIMDFFMESGCNLITMDFEAM